MIGEEITSDWCHFHYRDEPLQPDGADYLLGGECWHVFRTEAELVKETERHYPNGGAPHTGGAINICPFCTHDF